MRKFIRAFRMARLYAKKYGRAYIFWCHLSERINRNGWVVVPVGYTPAHWLDATLIKRDAETFYEYSTEENFKAYKRKNK